MKSISKILIGLALLTGLQSCDLERTPLTSLSSDNFWDNPKNATLALTAIYRGQISNIVEYNVILLWPYQGYQFMEQICFNAFE